MIKKLSIAFLFFTLFVLLGCKKEPTYNPFDQAFDISINKVIKNGCDTMSAGCGYYNLIEKSPTSRMYYQIYSTDFFEVVAKGYVYNIDTFRLEKFDDYYGNKVIRDSLIQLEFDIAKINRKIKKYNYSYFDRNNEILRIVNKELLDTVELRFNLAETDHPNYFVRNLEYFVSRLENGKE